MFTPSWRRACPPATWSSSTTSAGEPAVDLTPLRVSRPLRLLVAGRTVSVFGIGMLMVVLTVQTYELTESSLQVALVNSVLGLSAVAGSLLGGVLADRHDRRRVILLSRGLAVAGFAVLAVNAALPEPSVALLYVFAVWDGLTGSMGSAAFGAAVPSVVPPALLPATGAVMALSLDVGSIVAPLLGGVIAGAAGALWVYVAVVAVSVVSWLFLVRLDPLPPGGDETRSADEVEGTCDGVGETARRRWSAILRRGFARWWSHFTEGLRFVRADRVVGAVLLIGFLQILFASPFVLVPEFVERQLGAGPEAVGLIFSASSAGALIAGLLSGWVERVHRVGWVLVGVFVLSSLGVTGFALAPSVAVAAVAMALIGVTDVIGEIVRFTVLAERTPDRLRGRVDSIWSVQTTVGDALGGPVLSLGARAFGVVPAIAAGGLLAAAGTALLLLVRPELRRLVRTPEPDGPGQGELGPRPPLTPQTTATTPEGTP